MTRFRSKSYFWIPFGEIQYEHKSHSITIWIGVHKLRLWRGRL